MGHLGPFDTDSAALQRRIQAHETFGKSDLNTWIFKNLAVEVGHHILDLGSGTGKQSIPLAEQVGPEGRIVSVDASGESLGVLRAAAQERRLQERITTLQVSLDEIASNLGDVEFDRAVASYSLYYTENPSKMIGEIAKRIKTDGVLFFCGPSLENNAELKRFHHALRHTQPKLLEAARFMEETGPACCRAFFETVEVVSFENALEFNSPDALYDYWRSYNLYDVALENDFRKAAESHFVSHEEFTTVKRVIGVKASK